MSQIDMPVDNHVRDAMLEGYQRYMPKMTNITKLKDCYDMK